MQNNILYKYRGIQEFRYFVDILLNERLYAANYFELNDPMEGHYIVDPMGGIDTDIKRMLKSEKEKLRLCALSRRPDIELMWAHYANGDRGIAIGATVDSNKYEVRDIKYQCSTPRIGRHNLDASTATDILSCKLDSWKYEEETRIFVKKSQFIKVQLHEIIIGHRMPDKDRAFIEKLVKKLCPYVNLTAR
jgi:hypothetical protein